MARDDARQVLEELLELRDDRGKRVWSKAAIARELDRDEKMVRKITTGAIPGEKLLPGLLELRAGQPVTPIERGPVSEQRTPAGRYTQVTAKGMVGLMRSLGRDPDQRSYLRIEYRDHQGRVQEGTLYRNGGDPRADILEALENILAMNGGTASDPADILEALEGLIDYENSRPRGGASNLVGIASILTVRVEPA